MEPIDRSETLMTTYETAWIHDNMDSVHVWKVKTVMGVRITWGRVAAVGVKLPRFTSRSGRCDEGKNPCHCHRPPPPRPLTSIPLPVGARRFSHGHGLTLKICTTCHEAAQWVRLQCGHVFYAVLALCVIARDNLRHFTSDATAPWSRVTTMCTTRFNSKRFCFVFSKECVYFSYFFLEWRVIISLNSINQLTFVMETRCFFFKTRTEFLNFI
jgi:hypothetical protein